MDILCNKIITLWPNYIEYSKKLKYKMITNTKFDRIIFYIIYLKLFGKEILSILAKKTIYKMAYKLGLKAYIV